MMGISQLFFLAFLVCSGSAYPRQSAISRLSMEGDHSYVNHNFRSYQGGAFAQQVQQPSEVNVCKSIRPAVSNTATPVTDVHLCQQGDSVCYFSTLKTCCFANGAVPAGSSQVTLGSKTFEVRFNQFGGIFSNGAPKDVCFVVTNDDVDICQTSASCEKPGCVPIDEACQENVEPGTTCNLDTGCQCKRGYQGPTCCDCAPNFFRPSPSDECEELCIQNCARRGGPFGCLQCHSRFTGLGCCECAGDLIGPPNCECPSGQLLGNNNRCIMCPSGQVLNSADECVCPSGQLEGTNGRCITCLPGQVLDSSDQCVCPPGQLTGSQGQCITCPTTGHVLDQFDRCVCPSGQIQGSNGQCVTCRGDQVLNSLDQCVCPPGRIEFSGSCVDPCEENCAPNEFDSTFGCSLCLPGYRTRPLCCDCTSDRVSSGGECVCPPNTVANSVTGICEACPGNKVPSNGVCVCPTGTIEQGDNCISCPAPREVRDGICQCPVGQEEGPNGGCIIPPTCGENQNIIFVQDITQSFSAFNFRSVMHALQFVVGTLKARQSDNINVGVVLYPYIFDRKKLKNRPSSVAIGLNADCSTAVQGLENLSYNIFFSLHQSENTRSYEAMEFIENDVVNTLTQPTTVLTITDGVSDQDPSSSRTPVARITEAINKVRLTRPDIRFFAAGVNIDQSVSVTDNNDFNQELKALGGGIDSHFARTDSNVQAFITTIVDLLVDANVLCPDQRTEILNSIGGNSLSNYATCIQRNQFTGVTDKKCYPDDICSSSTLTFQKMTRGRLTSQESRNDLEQKILEAVEEVLNRQN